MKQVTNSTWHPIKMSSRTPHTSTRARESAVPPAPDLHKRFALTRAEAAASLGCSIDFSSSAAPDVPDARR
jgi:hypothetical protein